MVHRVGKESMFILILGALVPFSAAPQPNATVACPTDAIVVVHATQPTPCDLDGSQTLVLVGLDQAGADHHGCVLIWPGLGWDCDY
jgi:hypothetical protein